MLCSFLRLLLRRNGQGDDITRVYRHLLADRCPVTAHRIRKKLEWTGSAKEVSGNSERVRALPGSESQPNSLAATDGVDYHVIEALVLHLNDGGFRGFGAFLSRATGTRDYGCKRGNDKSVEHHHDSPRSG